MACYDVAPPHGSAVPELKGLRDDVYRRPLATAFERLGIAPGWVCADVGAGGGDVSVALAEVVGQSGRVYSVDSDPFARDEVARRAAAHSQVIAITQAGEDLLLPEEVDLAFCRFLLLHVVNPAIVLAAMAKAVSPGGWVVVQEAVTSAGRIGGVPMQMPDALHPDIGALLPSLITAAGLELVDSWAEAQAGMGGGPLGTYLETLTGVAPKDEPIVLPPLVTVISRRPGPNRPDQRP
ncbi:MAG: class I SAM-dependent methyltransferase [Acidimicrobiales bacterium]